MWVIPLWCQQKIRKIETLSINESLTLFSSQYRMIRVSLLLQSYYQAVSNTRKKLVLYSAKLLDYYTNTCLLFNSLITPWSRVRLEKLCGSELAKKFPAFYGIWMFNTATTSVRHLFLSWAWSIQSIPLHPTSRRSILTHSLP